MASQSGQTPSSPGYSPFPPSQEQHLTQPGLSAVSTQGSLCSGLTFLCPSPGPSSLISVPCQMERGLGSMVAQDCPPRSQSYPVYSCTVGDFFLIQTELMEHVVPSSSSEVPNFWPNSVDPSRPNPESRFYLSSHGQNGLDTFLLCTIC